MPYFFANDALIPGRVQSLKGEEVRHIRLSRKIRPGEVVVLQDPLFRRYSCTITKIKNSYIEFKTNDPVAPPPLRPYTIHVAVAVVKEKALDLIFQKCTELGVGSIDLFQSEYSQRLPTGVVRENKLKRWHKITVNACKQCERQKPPPIRLYDGVVELLSARVSMNLANPVTVHLGEMPAYSLPFRIEKNSETLLIVGPEGGFSNRDLTDLPTHRLNLGPLLLRTETAVVSAVSAVRALFAVANHSL